MKSKIDRNKSVESLPNTLSSVESELLDRISSSIYIERCSKNQYEADVTANLSLELAAVFVKERRKMITEWVRKAREESGSTSTSGSPFYNSDIPMVVR